MIRAIANLCLSLFIIGVITAAGLYAYNLPGEPAGIQSAEHQIEVVKHVIVRGK